MAAVNSGLGAAGLADAGDGRLFLGYADDQPDQDRDYLAVRLLGTTGADVSTGEYLGDGDFDKLTPTPTFGGVARSPVDGKAFLAGSSLDQGQSSGVVVQANASGTFGGEQHSKTFQIDGAPTFINDIVVQADGKVVVVGAVGSFSSRRVAVARFTAAGDPDTSFGDGGDGAISFEVPGRSMTARGVALDGAGRILLAGEGFDDSSGYLFAARLTSGGQADSSFSGNGFNILQIGDATSPAFDVAVHGDGLVVSTELRTGDQRGLAAVRFTAAGALDTDFGGGDGIADVTPANDDLEAGGVAVDAAGRILVGGSVIQDSRWAVARFTATGAADPAFGAGGLSTFSMPSGDSRSHATHVLLTGDVATLSGYTVADGHPAPTVARVDARAGQAPAEPTPSEPAVKPQPAVTPDPTPTPVPQSKPANVVTVLGIDFTVVASTKKRVRLKNYADDTGWEVATAYQLLRDKVPYVSIDVDFAKSACSKRVNRKTGAIAKQSPKSGEFEVDDRTPLNVKWTVCLDESNFEATCSAKKASRALSRTDSVKALDDFMAEIDRCTVEYDVKLVKKGDQPQLGKISNEPSKKKRKPITAAIECPTDQAEQHINVQWSEGVSRPSTYGFHEAHPTKGWMLPAGEESFFKLTVTDTSYPMRPLAAKVYLDVDDVGMPYVAPRTIDRRGELIYNVRPARPGLIKACVVFEVAGAGDGSEYAFATASIRVLPRPQVGDVWRTTSGRTILMTKQGPKQQAAPSQARAAAFDPFGLWSLITSLFAGQSAAVNQIAQSQPTPAKQVAAARSAGIGAGQIGNGGQLGRQPQPARVVRGQVVTVTDGRLAVATAPVLAKAAEGTQVATAAHGVVAVGGANVSLPATAGVVARDSATLLDLGKGGTIIGTASGNLIGTAAGNLIGTAAGNLIGTAAGNFIAPASPVVAVGGDN